MIRIIFAFFLVFIPLNVHAHLIFEDMRIGIMKNDIHGVQLHRRHEKGYNFNVELLTPPFTQDLWYYLLKPKIHGGISLNNCGGTNHLYAGLTWIISLGPILIEPSFGFGLNTAKHKHPSRRRQALGSPILFRESIGVGYSFSPSPFSVYLFLDHVSNAHLACTNPGLTTFGMRMGYKF